MTFTNALQQLETVFGGIDAHQAVPYYLPTSLPNINMAISGSPDLGFPGGRIITIAGPESCGKTALATELMAQGQQLSGFAFFADYEHAFHHEHAAALGLEIDPKSNQWFYKKPYSAEEGFKLTYAVMKLLRAGELNIELPNDTDKKPNLSNKALRDALHGIDLSMLKPITVTMDSIASMTPEAQDIDFEKQNMKTSALSLAAFLSLELKRLARDADMTGSTIILLNQLRDNPGVMFGEKEKEPGGNAMKYYASVQLRLRRVAKWYEEYEDYKTPVIGDVVEMFVRKNKIYRPFKKTKYVFRTVPPVGLDIVGTMIMLGKEAGALGPVSGKTIHFEGKKNWTVSKLDAACRADADLRKRIVDYVMNEVDPVEDGQPIGGDYQGAE